MATQTKTAYEQAKENYFLYQNYVVAEQKTNEGNYPQNLPDLAAKVAEEEGRERGSIDEEVVESFRNSTNLFALSKFLKPGVERFGKNHENYMKQNLEEIIDSTPVDKLQGNLFYIKPEDVKKYKELTELHKEAAEMQMNLGVYKSKEAPQELKAQALNKIYQTSLNYFEEKYKDSPSFLGALFNYIQRPDGEEIILAKYAKIASEKTAEFNDKVKDKVVPYAKAVLSKENAPVFYEILFRSDVA